MSAKPKSDRPRADALRDALGSTRRLIELSERKIALLQKLATGLQQQLDKELKHR